MTDNQNRVLPLAKLEEDCLRGPSHNTHASDAICDGKGKVPLIRTSRGRALKRECPNAKPQDETPYARFMVCVNGQYKFANGIGSCPTCKGRGWLPVGEDEARAICEDWLHERGYLLTIGNHVLITHEGVSNMDSIPIHDHDIAGAVFEAVTQIAKEQAHVS